MSVVYGRQTDLCCAGQGFDSSECVRVVYGHHTDLRCVRQQFDSSECVRMGNWHQCLYCAWQGTQVELGFRSGQNLKY